MDDESRQHMVELRNVLQKRLYVLEVQQGTFGINTPAHIVTEINDIRAELRRTKIILIASTNSEFRALRGQTLKAYYLGDWDKAHELLSRIVMQNPDDTDMVSKLEEVQRHLSLQTFYEAICELRDLDRWQAVLNALKDLEQSHPNYPGTQELRTWAEARQKGLSAPDSRADELIQRLRRQREQRGSGAVRAGRGEKTVPKTQPEVNLRYNSGDQVFCLPYGDGIVRESYIEDGRELLSIAFPDYGELTIDPAVSLVRKIGDNRDDDELL